MRTIYSNWFYGNEVSEYGKKCRRVDYYTLSKAFDSVLCNNIMCNRYIAWEEWEQINGDEDNCSEEIYQYYIISESGAEILMKWTDDYVWYNAELDIYVWGITHYGTGWAYVLTDIEIEGEDYEEN